jgi:hypothetical protein
MDIAVMGFTGQFDPSPHDNVTRGSHASSVALYPLLPGQ